MKGRGPPGIVRTSGHQELPTGSARFVSKCSDFGIFDHEAQPDPKSECRGSPIVGKVDTFLMR